MPMSNRNFRWALFIFVFLLICVFGATIYNWDLGINISMALKPNNQCNDLFDFVLRFAGFTVGLIISICLVYLTKYIANRLRCDMKCGNTMPCFLFHYFFLIPLWDVLPQLDNRLSLAICILLSFLICWVFSQKRLIMFFQWMLDFNFIKEKYNCFLTKKEGQK